MTAQSIQHLAYRFCQMALERIFFHLHYRLSQLTNDGVNRRCGCMSAIALRLKFYIHHAFFCSTDQCTFPFYAREYIFHHCAAFIDYHCQMNASLFKPFYNLRTGNSVNLFISAECEIDVMVRNKAFSDQFFCSLHDTAESTFCIEGSTAPDLSVFQNTVKCRFLPLVLFYRNHIVMGHENHRIALFFTHPAI